MTTQSTKSLKLFYCYAREDKALRDELDKHLSGLKREYHIASWSDGEIIPGTEWQKEIDTQLNTANIILLLISAHFMASDYCYGIEMKRALERHEAGTARVIPIILRPVYWENAPFSKLQVLPTDAKPVSRWTDCDEAFWDITMGIRNAMKELIILLKKEERLGKGLALANLKRYNEALTAYEQALRLDPSYALAWHGKGFALEKLGRSKEAQQCYEKARQLGYKT
ncbi:MAG TPA: TIR domain-containing protein [Ktedonobacteraceae bacterium]|nr:TIR domain-containing protein [Ktedonobacteraceae bacterium]